MQPFTIDIDDEALDDLERRLRAARWTEDPLAEEDSYGLTVTFTRTTPRSRCPGRSPKMCAASPTRFAPEKKRTSQNP